MLEARQTPAFHAMAPRPLSEHEVAVIRAWHSKAEEQQRKDLGDALAAAQSNIMVHTTTQADRVIQEVPQAVQGIIAEELDKRIGPPPQGTMEEALADRKRLNQRIRQLRKEAEENAKLEQESFGDVEEPAAAVSDNGRESAKKRARIETPSGEEKQRRAQKRARPAETQSARGRWAKKQLTAVSIFSGAGGMDVGFTRAGFKVLWAADANQAACDTYNHNAEVAVSRRLDLRTVDFDELRRELPGPVDCLFGGPPCQGYSQAGRCCIIPQAPWQVKEAGAGFHAMDA